MNLLFVSIFVFVLNLPFGYWRANVRRYGLQWVLAIHIPVPFVIAARIFSNIGFEFYTYPILIGAFFLGQYLGKYLYTKRKNLGYVPLTSCLVMDLVRNT
jgi:hypothetical protein